MFLIQVVSVIGAILILLAYALIQLKVWNSNQKRYSITNLLGALLLSSIAFIEKQYGFLLLESAWAVISFYALAGKSIALYKQRVNKGIIKKPK